ncbi:MAG: DUF1080 domain-containing protein [Daejeonella sp.]|uniref:3-keto-disaccharide hydrolase n=1 Tax=Daejeonella sp. TaxID=2805397 RepID=UPI003C77E2B6
MIKSILGYCIILLLFTIGCSPKFSPLFNNNDLSGWKIHGTEKWYVQNGELISESGPDKGYGYLATDKNYKNFILSVEFKQEANGNSGVFIRSNITGTRVNGWQVEVAPPGLFTGGIYESYGRNWLIKPDPEDEKVLKPDDWNKMIIEARNDEVTTWLNGKQMVYLKDELIGKGEGSIALQIHSGGGIKVRWRNIKIQQLP